MNKKLRLLVSLALLSLLARRLDGRQLQAAFADLRWEFWLAAVALYLGTQVVSALRWKLLSRPLGLEGSLGQFIAYYFVGMFFNLLLPTSVGGDVVRAWYLDGGSGQRLAAFLSVFVDRFSGLLVLLALACVAVACCPIALPLWIPTSVWMTAAGAILGIGVLPLLARRFQRFERPGRLVAGLQAYRHQPGLIVATTGLSLVVQAANVVLVWLVGQALALPIPAGYYWIFVPMVTLLTLMPISLNGMGIREGATWLFLAPLAVPQGLAVSLAVLWFGVFMAASLCGAGVYLFGRFPRPGEHLHAESIRRHSDQGRAGQSAAAA